MGREWKPGDVVSVDRMGMRQIAIRAQEPSGWWFTQHGSALYDEHADSIRPLVVIDPEDREQVERLTGLHALYYNTQQVDRLQAALREFANPSPPKPRCSAHGEEECDQCSRITAMYLDGLGGCTQCSVYAETGMHWDTCRARLRGPLYATQADAKAAL